MNRFIKLNQKISGNISEIYINSNFISEYSKNTDNDDSIIFCNFLYKIDVTETPDQITEKLNAQPGAKLDIINIDCTLGKVNFENNYIVSNIVAFFETSENLTKIFTVKGNPSTIVNINTQEIYNKIYE